MLVQDKYSPPLEELESINGYTWLEVKLLRPQLRVRLESSNRSIEQHLLQENAPVDEVITTSPYPLVSHSHAINMVENYCGHLTMFAHYGLPRKFGSRRFQERADTSYVLLARGCPHLHTIVIRERVSTATVMIVAKEAKALRTFHVRKNAVLIKSDWPRPDFWSDEDYSSLVKAARSMEVTEQEVSLRLHHEWAFLDDREFRLITL